ncbi:MAG TPA: CBS domain-containing protein [Candidatus Omnitrophota bacterium]|nr:CBS domain-containing protein [Candidatus Omnitrophota bacterium]
MENVLVSDIMTRSPITVSPGTNLLDCAKFMVKKKVGSLLLTENKKLVGFISEKDILWALVKKSKQDLSKITAMEISPKKIITINPSYTIQDAINKMKSSKFERLPVVQNGELVGIVTFKDILSFHPEFYPELQELSHIKEASEKLRRMKNNTSEGTCERCGTEDVLSEIDGMMICASCRKNM